MRAKRQGQPMPRIVDLPLQVGASIAFAWVWYVVVAHIFVHAEVQAIVMTSIEENRSLTVQEMETIVELKQWKAPFNDDGA